ncbi:hypothetical protein MXAN_7503 [Myxococcus xanthus DK 1622]|uniref:Uncharacterized protein n=1 Tax=Myxococcus xanthus (strain DK1622) TaxID=246197 RepID=Q1CVG7_MYXXD|nr:hypothetical protein MXAN_7503 [Myxococcus xanthus DK 1622]
MAPALNSRAMSQASSVIASRGGCHHRLEDVAAVRHEGEQHTHHERPEHRVLGRQLRRMTRVQHGERERLEREHRGRVRGEAGHPLERRRDDEQHATGHLKEAECPPCSEGDLAELARELLERECLVRPACEKQQCEDGLKNPEDDVHGWGLGVQALRAGLSDAFSSALASFPCIIFQPYSAPWNAWSSLKPECSKRTRVPSPSASSR